MQQALDRSGIAFKIVVAALGLGSAAAYLLRPAPWGANFPLWILLAALCGFGLLRKAPVSPSRSALWMALPVLLFSAFFLWRDSDDLKIANGFAVFLALGVLVLRHERGQITRADISDYTHRLALAWLSLAGDFASLVVHDLEWRKHPAHAAKLKALTRGVVLAVPVLLLFGGLFVSADEVFGSSLSTAFSFDPTNMAIDTVIFVAAAVVTGGVFRRMLLRGEPALGPVPPPRVPPQVATLGAIEIGTIFGLLDLLFLTFVFVQFRYFFGGAARVAQVAGLGYAQYARHGFFELTSAALLVLPVVLGAQLFIAPGDRRAHSTFRLLSGLLMGCVLVVLDSAFQRMNLYVSVYGLSELRLLTTFVMAWIAVTLIWLCVTVLASRRDRFSFGALVAGFAVILSLNVADPDAMIARTNLDPSRRIDVAYLSNLSLDAAPVVADRLGSLPAGERQQLVAGLKPKWDRRLRDEDWRSENLAAINYAAKYRRDLDRP